MPRTRRTVLAQAAAVAALPAGAALAQSAAPVMAPVMAYIGAFSTGGPGIHPFRFDPETGVLTRAGPPIDFANATWLEVDSARGLLFAASEVDSYGPGRTGSVGAFAIDPADGSLELLNTVGSGGAAPTHISRHPSGRWLFVANYDGGSVAVLRIEPDGRLAGPIDVKQLTHAPGYDPAKSLSGANLAVSDHARPHMHMIHADPSGRFVIAADAGSDRLCIWRFDLDAGKLSPAATPFVDTPAGSAPRHFVFSADGTRLYLLREHDNMLTAYAFSPETGVLTWTQALSTLPESFAGSSLSSELALSEDGRFLYAGARFRNSITTFSVATSGELTRTAETWVQADFPRSFALAPGGRFLIACNHRSDNLTTFLVDPASGVLDFTGRFEPVPAPAVVVFHRMGG
jgi:6-phosphogluconolactonase (cycloisomerase 2 family)